MSFRLLDVYLWLPAYITYMATQRPLSAESYRQMSKIYIGLVVDAAEWVWFLCANVYTSFSLIPEIMNHISKRVGS